MDPNVLLGIVSIALSILSIIYAVFQSRRLSNAQRDELISLWASLERVWELHDQQLNVLSLVDAQTDGKINTRSDQLLHEVFKGLREEYVRIAELIVKKDKGIAVSTIEKWRDIKKIQNDWQEGIFTNLILYSSYEKRPLCQRILRPFRCLLSKSFPKQSQSRRPRKQR